MTFYENSLSRLLYISTVAPEYRGTASVLANSIVRRSIENNRRNGLTGCLLQVEDRFIQVLEGAPEDLEDTFERICCDMRHVDLKLVDHSPVVERLFGDWEMACVSDAQGCSIPLREELSHLRVVASLDAPSTLREMRQLLDRHSKHAVSA